MLPLDGDLMVRFHIPAMGKAFAAFRRFLCFLVIYLCCNGYKAQNLKPLGLSLEILGRKP